MKKTILFTFILLQFFVTPLFAQFGYLDSSFHADGIVTTDFGVGDDAISSTALQPDGKIVAAGSSFNGVNYDFAIARYLPNGSLDSTFSDDGKLTLAFGADNDYIRSVAIQPDGKIVVAGQSQNNGSNTDFALARYLPDGSLDSSFSNDGMLIVNMGVGNNGANSLALQSDGKIVVAGSSLTVNFSDFALARLMPDGRLDSSLNGVGFLTTGIGAYHDYGNAVVVQPDGKILVAGYSVGGYDIFSIVRYLPDGSLDNSFGGSGKRQINVSGYNNRAYSLVLQADNKIIVAGTGEEEFALARLLPNGTLDNSFSSDGKVTTSFGANITFIYGNDVAIDTNGKIIMTGVIYKGNYDFALSKYLPNGNLDSSFSDDGIHITALTSLKDYANSLFIQPDGKIVLAGESSNGTNADFAIVRYISYLTLGTIDFSTAIEQALIYPNPISNNTKLSYSLTNTENINIYLLDMTGRKIKTYLENKQQIAGSYEQAISLPENLPAGTYLLVVSSEKGKVTVKVLKD